MSNLSISRAWDETKSALRANRRLLVPVALGLVLLPATIASMVEPQVAPNEQPEPGLWMLVVLAMLIVMLVGQLAIVLLINGWKGSVGESISQAARRAPTLILAAILIAIPVVVLLSLVVAMTGLGAGGLSPAKLGGAGALALLLCIILLLILSIRLLPLVAVVASEQIGPIASLARAFSLTAGHFWRLFGFVVMAMIGFLIVALTVGAVIGGLVALLLGPPAPWTIALLLVALAGGLVQAGFVMVYTAMLARIYVQLSAPLATVPEVKRDS